MISDCIGYLPYLVMLKVVTAIVINIQVKELEYETNSRKRIASGGQLDNVISEEQRKQLELNIKEQETLLQGYQKVLHLCMNMHTYIALSITLYTHLKFT